MKRHYQQGRQLTHGPRGTSVAVADHAESSRRCNTRLTPPCVSTNALLLTSCQAGLCRGAVAFENVSLRYAPHAAWALEAVSLDIRPGQLLGICGRTGASSSNLIVTKHTQHVALMTHSSPVPSSQVHA